MSAFWCDRHGKYDVPINGRCPECERERMVLEWAECAYAALWEMRVGIVDVKGECAELIREYERIGK